MMRLPSIGASHPACGAFGDAALVRRSTLELHRCVDDAPMGEGSLALQDVPTLWPLSLWVPTLSLGILDSGCPTHALGRGHP